MLKDLFAILTPKDKKRFWGYLVVLFVGSSTSVLGIGAIMPFIYVLIDKDKATHVPLIGHLPYQEIVIICSLLLIVAFLVKNMVSALLMIYQSKFLGAVTYSLQNRLYYGYLGMPYESHLNRKTPDLIRNLTTLVGQFSSGVISPLGVIFTEVFSLIFIFITLMFINWIFTVVMFGVMSIAIIIFLRVFREKNKYHSNQSVEASSNLSRVILEGLNGIKEVKLYHKEEIYNKLFEIASNKSKKAAIFAQLFPNMPRMIIEVTGIIVLMLAICLLVLLGNDSKVVFTVLSVFAAASIQMLPSLNRLSQSIANIKFSTPCLLIIKKELDEVNNYKKIAVLTDVEDLLFNNSITLSNINYSYSDGTNALNGVNLQIPKGKKVAFIGKSGAGKTTLVDLLMGFYKPVTGKITLDNTRIDDKNIMQFQKLFAYIPQNIVLHDCSIRDNIAFGDTKIDDDKVWQALKMSQIDTFVSQLEGQLDSFVGEGGVRLSGGQRQRLGIARALYRNPQILVMDEATSALDNNTEAEITEVLYSLENITLITIAHRLTTIRGYDLIYVLQDGKVVASGSYDDLSLCGVL
jgi:ATP-binding cassette subfamily C protein